VKTYEAARPTLKTFDMTKAFTDLNRETDLKRTLRHKWSLMLTPAKPVEEKATAADYMSELNEFALVNSVPEFCEAWNRCHLEGRKPYSKIVVFKKGIKPVWEDPDNKKGGRFVIRGATMEETLSMFIVIVTRLMTGRLQSDYNDLCGAVLQAKGSDQLWIQVWNKDAGDADQINRVKIFLNRLTTRTIAYQVHDLSLKMSKSRQNKNSKETVSEQKPGEPAVAQAVVDDFVKDFLAAV
jgi:translation initiation factor 4E